MVGVVVEVVAPESTRVVLDDAATSLAVVDVVPVAVVVIVGVVDDVDDPVMRKTVAIGAAMNVLATVDICA